MSADNLAKAEQLLTYTKDHDPFKPIALTLIVHRRRGRPGKSQPPKIGLTVARTGQFRRVSPSRSTCSEVELVKNALTSWSPKARSRVVSECTQPQPSPT